MKKNLTLWAIIAVFGLMASFAYAGAGIGMRIHIPFDFYLEDQLLPSGEYSFEMDSGTHATASHVIVWSTEGTANKMLLTSPGADHSTSMNQLTFNKYGKKYFLSTVLIGGHKATLKVFKLEKELRGQMENKSNTIAIAQR